MAGDDRARRCGGCGLWAVNRQGLSAEKAVERLRELEGDFVVERIHGRADGTILKQDCPVGAARARRRVVNVLVVHAIVFLLLGVIIDRAGGGTFTYRPQLWFIEPFRRVVMRLDDYFRPPPAIKYFESLPTRELPPTP